MYSLSRFSTSNNGTDITRSESVDTVPPDFKCPITLEIMEDPVMTSDGHSYERNAIEMWFRTQATSPRTGQPLSSKVLIPNMALRMSIEEWSSRHVATGTTVAQSVVPIVASAVVQPMVEPEFNVSYEAIKQKTKIHAMLLVQPPVLQRRLPIRLIVMVDISGSMGSSIDQPGTEQTGLSRLDLVKHAIRTIIASLSGDDYLSIIPFSTDASVLVPLTQMTEEGKRSTQTRVDRLEPTNSTNIYSAIKCATRVSQDPICSHNNTFGVLLTDGEDTVPPARGLLETIKLDQLKPATRFNGVVMTYGFSYDVNSFVLSEISKLMGQGSFGFIPDKSMLATNIINGIATALATVKTEYQIGLRTNCRVVSVKGAEMKRCPNEDVYLSLSMPQSEQPRVILVELEQSHTNEIVFTFDQRNCTVSSFREVASNEMKVQETRWLVISSLERALTVFSEANLQTFSDSQEMIDIFKSMSDSLEKCITETNDPRVITIKREFTSSNPSEGQIMKAFATREGFNRWGKHHTRSFIRAHSLSQCNNFKDPSVQLHGGELFREYTTSISDYFDTLPPPVPSINIQPTTFVPRGMSYNGGGRGAPAPVAQPLNMRQFNNASGGCFGSNTIVKLFNCCSVFISDLRTGMVLSNGAIVKCVVKNIHNNSTPLVWFKKENLYLTPWHPVRYEGKWQFPNDLLDGEDIILTNNSISTYNFVLDTLHCIPFDNIDACTLAHGFTDNQVISHDFFGTHHVIDTLEKMEGYWEGYIVIDENVKMIRDAQTGQIVDYKL
jgi:hypothetical protein